jgi:Thiamine pyrophosphate-requiring enzymes [acetolactate synthase, pyruvate dehydrogenase (cytochrome), glyoxylate carboligase, phosphonopyruvate decarboxylase]
LAKCAGAAPGAGLSREAVIAYLLDRLEAEDALVSTTGKTSRELYELRRARGKDQSDFLTVGSMGHASSIALAAALARPGKRLVCLDGDGAALMHLGSLALIGRLAPGLIFWKSSSSLVPAPIWGGRRVRPPTIKENLWPKWPERTFDGSRTL